MKTLSIILIAGLLLPLGGLAAEPDKGFPVESAVLLKKLADWEKNEKALLDAKVREKRATVAKLLETHLKTATKAGNLKAANLVQAAIVKIRPPEVKLASTPIGEGKVGDDPKLVGGIELGQFWHIHKGNNSYGRLRVTEEGMELYYNNNSSKDEPDYTIETRVENNVIQYHNLQLKKWIPIVVDKRGRELSVLIGNTAGSATAVFRK